MDAATGGATNIAINAITRCGKAQRPLLIADFLHGGFHEIAHRGFQPVPPIQINKVAGHRPGNREVRDMGGNFRPARGGAGTGTGNGAIHHTAFQCGINFRKANANRLRAKRGEEIHQRIPEGTNTPAAQIIQAGEGGAAEYNLRREGIHGDQARAKPFKVPIGDRQHRFGNAPRVIDVRRQPGKVNAIQNGYIAGKCGQRTGADFYLAGANQAHNFIAGKVAFRVGGKCHLHAPIAACRCAIAQHRDIYPRILRLGR